MSQNLNPNFVASSQPEPHIGRTKKLLQAHPQLRSLFGNTPISFVYVAAMVAAQIALAIAAQLYLSDAWGVAVLLGLAFTVGATFNHALFVMIHEATHNLIFKGSVANRLAGIFANLPIVFPCAMGFRAFHLLHHRYQGELEFDADLAGPKEAAWVGNKTSRKALWLLFFFVIEGIVRPLRVKKVNVAEPWGLFNLAIELSFLAVIFFLVGPWAFAYLGLSTVFSIGLHPLGARWIQEHYVMVEGQETYSYYGPLNAVTFNVGFHNEHHDLMMVPWSRLPRVKAMAPEFYESLYAHRSWTGLLFRFLFDPKLTLFSRVVRPSHLERQRSSEISGEAIDSLSAALSP